MNIFELKRQKVCVLLSILIGGFWFCKPLADSQPRLWAKIPNATELIFLSNGRSVFVLESCFWNSCGYTQKGQIWDIKGHPTQTLNIEWDNFDMLPLTFSPDERFLGAIDRKACGGGGGDWKCDYTPDSIWAINVWENIDAKRIEAYKDIRIDGNQYRAASEFRGVWFENDKIVCEAQHFTRRFNIYTGKQTDIISRHWKRQNVLLSPDRNTLFSVSDDNNHTYFYDASNEELLWTWTNYRDKVQFSNHGAVVWGFKNKCAVGRNIRTGEEKYRVLGVKSSAFTIAPDGKSLWEIRDAKEIWVWPLI